MANLPTNSNGGPDLLCFGHAGHAAPLDSWRCCSHRRVMSFPMPLVFSVTTLHHFGPNMVPCFTISCTVILNCGLSYTWLNQNRIDKSKCKSIIHKRIEDIAHQKWYIDLSNSSLCITYKLFKKQLHFEKHLLNSNFKDRISLTGLRCSNSKLPIYNTIYL